LVPESLKQIEESLAWLGINYDGEKIFQSDRRNIHQKYANQLLTEGRAYKCFCSKERLDKLREEQQKKKLPPGYDNHCRDLSPKEVADYERLGDKYVIRFAMPTTGQAIWNDSIHGKMEISYSVSDDPIIIKSDGWPTYHLASVNEGY
jgi:glutamyl-tRNA synthetase